MLLLMGFCIQWKPVTPQNQSQTVVEKTNEEKPTTKQDVCEPILQDLRKTFADEASLTFNEGVLHLETQKIYSKKINLIYFLETVLQATTNKTTCVTKILFSAKQDGEFTFQGQAWLSDYDLLQKNKISKPEWMRRLSIRREAGLLTIQNNLKKARQNKNTGEALTWIDHWLSQDEAAIVPLVIKGNLSLENKDYQKALEIFENVLLLDPKNETALFNQAYAWQGSGQFDKAIAAFQKLIADFATQNFKLLTQDFLRLNLAKTHLQNLQFEDAEEVLAKIKTLSFERELLWAKIYRHKKEFGAANLKLQSALKLNADKGEILYNQILLELDQQKGDEAKVLFKQLQSQSPSLAKELEFLKLWDL